MKRIRLAEILLMLGFLIGFYALLNPTSLPIIVFFTLGHLLVFAGLIIYIRTVWQDLKKHKVL